MYLRYNKGLGFNLLALIFQFSLTPAFFILLRGFLRRLDIYNMHVEV